MRLRNVVWLFSTLAVVLACVGTATAQETTGTITGRIVDPQGLSVPGAAVTATGPQGAKNTSSDGNGAFKFPFLTPGTYAVKTELQGFKVLEQRNIDLRLGQTVELVLRLEVGDVAETVQVTATTPVVDAATTTIGANLDSEVLARIPVGRRVFDALYVVPGVSSGGGTGQANPSIGGGSGLENQYVIDGVNITNTGYGAFGTYSIVHGTLGNGVTFDFVKEIQVKTGGYEAEYGQSTGGMVNVLTKSGSNTLSGSLFTSGRLDALESDYKRVVLQNGAVNTTGTSIKSLGGQIGGPLVQNRAFFFGTVDQQWEERSLIAPPNFPLARQGEVSRERRISSYAGKATLQATSAHRFDASFFGDPAKGKLGPQRSAALLRAENTGNSEIEYGGHNQVVKYEGVLTPRWLLEASFARSTSKLGETPEFNQYSVVDLTVTPNRRFGGIGFYETSDGNNLQYQAKATNIIGNHQIRYGIAYEDIAYDSITNRSGPTFRLGNGVPTVTGASVQIRRDAATGQLFYRATRANYENVRHTEQQYLNFFVQDMIRVGPRLTIRPGIRYEQQKLIGNLADFKWDGNWAPRIGVTYDLLGNGRSKVYGSWGRFYAKVPNDLAARALSADAGISRGDYYDAALANPIPNGTAFGGVTTHLIIAGRHASDFDPEAKSTYQDEGLIGFEYEAQPGLNVGVRYVHRNMPRILEDIGTAAMVLYDLGAPGLDSVEYFITNPRNGYPATLNNVGAFEDPLHEYDSVEFTADKRFSNNWAVQTSYRWSKLWGNFEGFFRNDNGQSDPAITSLFDFPTNDPSYTEIGVKQFGYKGDIRYLGALGAGPLPNDRTHQLKVFGNYTWPMGLSLGSGLVFGSGAPLTPLAANPNYNSAGEIPEAPRGSGIQTVNGFRKRTDFETDVNIQVGYGLKMGRRKIRFTMDAFNLFDTKRARDYNNYTEIAFATPDPDFGAVTAYQIPRQIRLGARFEF